MIELKTQYPYIDNNGIEHTNLIKHYAEDIDTKKQYMIKQVETGIEYGEAIDLFPCKYSYIATIKEIEIDKDETLAEL